MSEVVRVAHLPECDLCRANRTITARACAAPPPVALAAYDARTKRGLWAYLCADHWATDGCGKLGTGFGQRLEVCGDE